MAIPRARFWIPAVALAGAAIGLVIGRASVPKEAAHPQMEAMRSKTVRLDSGILKLLESIPVLKAGNVRDDISPQAIEKFDPAANSGLLIYSLMPNESITVTPTAAYSDFVGIVASSTLTEFVAEPTNGHPAGGYISVHSDPLNQSPSGRNYVAVSLLDVPAGQRYLIDFQVAALNDGVTGIGCQWVLRANDVDVQVTPAGISSPNTLKEQHVFVIVEPDGRHFTYVELSNQSEDGANRMWDFESATVTRMN